LENAVSVASVLLLTEATMTEIPETKKDQIAQEMAMERECQSVQLPTQ